MIVYLGGTITKDPKHLNWRATLAQHLVSRGHVALSPMRGKDPGALSQDGLTSDIDPMLFTERDKADVASSNVVISAYFSGLPRQSLGTWIEAGWAIATGAIWIVYTNDPDVATHPFVRKWAAAVINPDEPNGLRRLLDTILWLA